MEPNGDLHGVIQNCREAKILLLHPGSEGASAHPKGLPDPELTPERYRDQITKTIHFLRGLKDLQKCVCWNDPAIPEFDFETGELVYRDGSGRRMKRETLGNRF